MPPCCSRSDERGTARNAAQPVFALRAGSRDDRALLRRHLGVSPSADDVRPGRDDVGAGEAACSVSASSTRPATATVPSPSRPLWQTRSRSSAPNGSTASTRNVFSAGDPHLARRHRQIERVERRGADLHEIAAGRQRVDAIATLTVRPRVARHARTRTPAARADTVRRAPIASRSARGACRPPPRAPATVRRAMWLDTSEEARWRGFARWMRTAR